MPAESLADAVTIRTVVNDGSKCDRVEELARFHGAVHMHRSENGSQTLIDGRDRVHTLPVGTSLVCTHLKHFTGFEVHEPIPQQQCRLVIRRDSQGLWQGWMQADQLPGGGEQFVWAFSQTMAIACANNLLRAWQEGWRPPAGNESRSPQRMQVRLPEPAGVPA